MKKIFPLLLTILVGCNTYYSNGVHRTIISLAATTQLQITNQCVDFVRVLQPGYGVILDSVARGDFAEVPLEYIPLSGDEHRARLTIQGFQRSTKGLHIVGFNTHDVQLPNNGGTRTDAIVVASNGWNSVPLLDNQGRNVCSNYGLLDWMIDKLRELAH